MEVNGTSTFNGGISTYGSLYVNSAALFDGKITAFNGFRKEDVYASTGKALLAINSGGDTRFGNYITVNEMFTINSFGIPPNGWHQVILQQQGVFQGVTSNNPAIPDGGVEAIPFVSGDPNSPGRFKAKKNGVYSIDFKGKWEFNPDNSEFRIVILRGSTQIVAKQLYIGNVLYPSFNLYINALENDLISIQAYHTRNLPLPFFYPCGDPFGILPPCPSAALGNNFQSVQATIVSY